MKKTVTIVSIVLTIALVLAGVQAFYMNEGIRVSIADSDLCLNGQIYSNFNLEKPFITYNRITYVPLSAQMGQVLGFSTE